MRKALTSTDRQLMSDIANRASFFSVSFSLSHNSFIDLLPMVSLSRILIGLALLYSWMPMLSYAKEVFVSASTGRDTNSGSEASPYATIGRGVATAAAAGDIITVKAGTYRERVLLSSGGSSAISRITLRAYTAPNGVRDLPQIIGSSHGILIQSSGSPGEIIPIGWITIDGFEISGAPYDGIKMYSAHNLIIKNNYIHNNDDNGILGRGSNVLIENNVIADNGVVETGQDWQYNQFHGIYITGSNFTIINNLFYRNLAYGIQMAGYGCTNSGGGQYRAEYCGATNMVIMNNTFAYQRNRGGLNWYFSGARGGVAQNNIFYNNAYLSKNVGSKFQAANGPEFVESGGGHVVNSNLYYSEIDAPAYGASVRDSNPVRLNPEFETTVPADSSSPALPNVLPLSDRFALSRIKALLKLTSGSPARDRAIPYTEVAVLQDFASVSRPQGTASDIGAYEYIPLEPPFIVAPQSPGNLQVGYMSVPVTISEGNERP